MRTALPGLRGLDHVGITVPDLTEATRFFVETLGCAVLFEAGPFESDTTWMADYLGVDRTSRIARLRMLRCPSGTLIELFEYEAPDQDSARPRNSDHGGHHLAFYVEDMESALAHLRQCGVPILAGPVMMENGPSAGLSWIYFSAPWGLQMELVSYPKGMAFQHA